MFIRSGHSETKLEPPSVSNSRRQPNTNQLETRFIHQSELPVCRYVVSVGVRWDHPPAAALGHRRRSQLTRGINQADSCLDETATHFSTTDYNEVLRSDLKALLPAVLHRLQVRCWLWPSWCFCHQQLCWCSAWRGPGYVKVRRMTELLEHHTAQRSLADMFWSFGVYSSSGGGRRRHQGESERRGNISVSSEVWSESTDCTRRSERRLCLQPTPVLVSLNQTTWFVFSHIS